MARIHGLLHTALDGEDGKQVGWMSAHLTKADLSLRTATKSDGSLVVARDVWANDVADKLAKLGVEYHRVPGEEVRRWKAAFGAAKARAKWIGIATQAAGNHDQFPFRDSDPRGGGRWRPRGIERRKRRGSTEERGKAPSLQRKSFRR